MLQARNKRKEKIGLVIGDKREKTITVQVKRINRQPWVGKMVKRYSKFNVHDEKKEAKLGDLVRIVETRPLSKTKRWRLVEVVTKK